MIANLRLGRACRCELQLHKNRLLRGNRAETLLETRDGRRCKNLRHQAAIWPLGDRWTTNRRRRVYWDSHRAACITSCESTGSAHRDVRRITSTGRIAEAHSTSRRPNPRLPMSGICSRSEFGFRHGFSGWNAASACSHGRPPRDHRDSTTCEPFRLAANMHS